MLNSVKIQIDEVYRKFDIKLNEKGEKRNVWKICPFRCQFETLHL